MGTIFSSQTFATRRDNFSLRSQNSEYPRISQVTEPNQNARKLLSTDLLNTKKDYGYAFQMFKVDRCEFKSVRVSTRLHQSFFLRYECKILNPNPEQPLNPKRLLNLTWLG